MSICKLKSIRRFVHVSLVFCELTFLYPIRFFRHIFKGRNAMRLDLVE